MALCVSIASCLPLEAEAVFTNLGSLVQGQNQIRIRVGAVGGAGGEGGGVDRVDFGAVPGMSVGNGRSVQPQQGGAVELSVYASTPGDGERLVTVTANSSGGMNCTTPASCGTITIPFSTVSWTAGNSVGSTNPGGDVQAGSFSGSTAQPIARFVSSKRLQSALYFRYENATVYPAGSYAGRVTFTASMP